MLALCAVFASCRLEEVGADSTGKVEGTGSPLNPQSHPAGEQDGPEELPDTPLDIVMQSENFGGIEAVYPHAENAGAGKLNNAVRSAAAEFAQQASELGERGRIRCEVKYNDRGLLSLLFRLKGSAGETEDVFAASFLTADGKRLVFSDCFGSCDGGYRFSLPDSITEKVKAMGYEVLSYLPPMDDNRLFYFDNKGLTLVYRLYEICGAEAGMPEVFFAYGELVSLMGEDSPLMRVSYFDGRGA